MTIAIDKYSLSALDNINDFIYLYDNEDYKDLIRLNIHCIYYKNCDYVDINLTDYEVECFKKAKVTDRDWWKIEKKNFKIAIIIPNYNYEHTIEKCLNSIFSQTYTNYEIIFVDDMSTDNSVKIASETYGKYLSSKDIYDAGNIGELKIIRLKQKRLNGGARNEAYLYVSDDTDYIYYVDSDDWLFDDKSLEKINNKLQNQPDVLFVGLADCKNYKTKTCFIPRYKDKYEAIQGWSGSCGKVIKKSLATRQDCLYSEGTLKEDRNQHRRICINMKTFSLLEEPVYVWNRDNTKSVTTIRDKEVWGTSTIRQYADTLQLALIVKGQDSKIDRIMNEAVRMTKKEMEEGNDRQW